MKEEELLKSEVTFLPVKDTIRGFFSGACGPRYVRRSGKSALIYVGANNLNRWCLSQKLPFGGSKFVNTVTKQDLIKAPDGSDFGYAVDINLNSPDN